MEYNLQSNASVGYPEPSHTIPQHEPSSDLVSQTCSKVLCVGTLLIIAACLAAPSMFGHTLQHIGIIRGDGTGWNLSQLSSALFASRISLQPFVNCIGLGWKSMRIAQHVMC